MSFFKTNLLTKTLAPLALIAALAGNSMLPAQAAEEGLTIQTPEEIVQTVQNEIFGVTKRWDISCPRNGSDDNITFSKMVSGWAMNPDAIRNALNSHYQDAIQSLVARLNSEARTWSSANLINKDKLQKLIQIDETNMRFNLNCSNNIVWLLPNTVKFRLTPLGESLLRMSIPHGAGVEASIVALGNALKSIKLIPSQKKVLKSFFEAAQRFYNSLQENTAKQAKGERPKLVTHRDFMNQASLLVAYHRYLKDTFDEAAQLSSEYSGVDGQNFAAVKCIEVSIQNLIEAYGLETDVTQRLVADYGRVLSDLLVNQLSPMVDEGTKQAQVRPVIIQLAKMIALSEANGDTLVQDETLKFRTLWEDQRFAGLMSNLLTATDLKLNGLILNINALAYKIGLANNITIRVLEKDDIDRIRNSKEKQK